MKSERHRKILEIINKNDIETQEELAAALIDAGFNVTQATVSRDIKMLNLTKMVVNGHKKYVVFKNDNNNMNDKYIRVLRDGFSDMDMAQNILVIKTVPGMAIPPGTVTAPGRIWRHSRRRIIPCSISV